MNRSSDVPEERLTRGPRRRAPGRGRRGQSLAEVTICIPVLLILALGILEVSRMLEITQVMASLTREGANIASRGATLNEALDATRANQIASGLGSGGGAVVSRLVVEDGVPRVRGQVATEGFAAQTRVGMPDSIASPYTTAGLREGQSYVAVEIFIPYGPITPFQRFTENIVPETLYDRSLF